MMRPPGIFLFPGMGADHRLIEPQRGLDGQVVVPPWLTPGAHETIETYAQRLAGTIDTSNPFFIGGVSFGGIIAQEIARHTSPLGVILIASCRRLRQIPRLYRMLGWAAMRAPALQQAVQIASQARFMFGIETAGQAKLLDQMLADADESFLRWSLRAMARWSGPVALEAPTLHIHGARDRIIPRRKVHPTHVIDGAGHIVNVTHADQVNGLINRWMRYVVSSTSSPSTTSAPREKLKS